MINGIGFDDDASDLEPGDKGPSGPDLMFAVDQEPIGEVRRGSLDLHDHLTGSEGRVSQVRSESRRTLLLDEPPSHQS